MMPALKRFAPIAVLVGLCWAVFLVNTVLWSGYLNRYGIVPRNPESLPGILWAPFLHGSFRHVAANTFPLLVLGAILCARSRAEFWLVTVAGTLVGGGLTWVFARRGSHIGASILIFVMFGYLASLAWFRRTLGAFLLSAVCLLGYGGLSRGLIPSSGAISWEGHAAGFVTGIALAWLGVRASACNPPAADPPAQARSKASVWRLRNGRRQ